MWNSSIRRITARFSARSPFGQEQSDDRLTPSSTQCFDRLSGPADSIIPKRSARLNASTRTEKIPLYRELPDLGMQVVDLRLTLLGELPPPALGEHLRHVPLVAGVTIFGASSPNGR